MSSVNTRQETNLYKVRLLEKRKKSSDCSLDQSLNKKSDPNYFLLRCLTSESLAIRNILGLECDKVLDEPFFLAQICGDTK